MLHAQIGRVPRMPPVKVMPHVQLAPAAHGLPICDTLYTDDTLRVMVIGEVMVVPAFDPRVPVHGFQRKMNGVWQGPTAAAASGVGACCGQRDIAIPGVPRLLPRFPSGFPSASSGNSDRGWPSVGLVIGGSKSPACNGWLVGAGRIPRGALDGREEALVRSTIPCGGALSGLRPSIEPMRCWCVPLDMRSLVLLVALVLAPSLHAQPVDCSTISASACEPSIGHLYSRSGRPSASALLPDRYHRGEADRLRETGR